MELATDIVLTVPLDALETDPYPTYEWMRRACPIAYSPEVGRVLVTTWDLCNEAGTNDAVFGPTHVVHDTVYGDPNVMSMSGDAHRDLRNAANAPFRPRAVQVYRDSRLRATAARYIEAVRERGHAEATGELLEPISQRAVGDILGFTDVDDHTLARWFHTYADYLVDAGRNPVTRERVRDVKAEVIEYLQRRLPALAEQPDGSALAHLVTGGLVQGRTRSVDDLIGTVGVLIVGGFQEPAHAVANTLLGLLGRPEQAARVAEDPARWSRPALEEGFRWIAPFGMTEKLTTADVSLGGLLFPAGTEVALVLGSANRDPARFDRPEVYELDRATQANQSFGYGMHFCIGHAVARSLGQVVLEEMFTRLPHLRFDPDEEPFVHGWQVRAAKRLPLVWDA